jgi:hypothetical protein
MNEEKYISATWAQTGSPAAVSPKSMGNNAVGGVDFLTQSAGVAQKGVSIGRGPNNVGLLVTVWGKVTQRQTATPKYFYIDDGSGLIDGTKTGVMDNVGIRVICDPAGHAEGEYIAITGVVSLFKDAGRLYPLILPTVTGIQVMRP